MHAQELSVPETSATKERQEALSSNWKDPAIPTLQRRVVDAQLENLRLGVVEPVFGALRLALQSVDLPEFSLLDAACATGYYREVIERLDGRPIRYEGCDYSEAMVEMARAHYPGVPFRVQDLTGLDLADRSFDVVLASGVLEHIPAHDLALSELCRVAKRYLIVHRCPTTDGPLHERTVGSQYSIETPRTFFNEAALVAEMSTLGFALVSKANMGGWRSRVRQWKRALVRVIRRGLGKPARRFRTTTTLVFGRVGES